MPPVDESDFGKKLIQVEQTLARLTDHEFIRGLIDGELALPFPTRIIGPTGTAYWIIREAGGNLATVLAPASASDWDDASRTQLLDLPMASFIAHVGTPTYEHVTTNHYGWHFDAAAMEVVVYSFTVPENYASGGFFRFWYTMASATSGDVYFGVGILERAEGENVDGANSAETWAADTVQDVADELGVLDITAAGAVYVPGERIRLIIGRDGVSGSDTATGDMHLLGCEFRYNE